MRTWFASLIASALLTSISSAESLPFVFVLDGNSIFPASRCGGPTQT